MNEYSAHLVRAVRGPILLITIGTLFAFDRFTEFRFSQTWPVLLIVFGVLSLLRRGLERPVPPPEGVGFPPYGFPPPPPPPSGGYRQSSYPFPPPPPAPPAGGPAKGGFGSSAAAPRPPETEQKPGESL